MIIFIYTVLIFLVIRFSVTLFNFLSNPKLPRSLKHYQDLVSILIPARNETENIIALLQSIEKQDYQNFEVIVLDDQSTDDTYTKVLHFCESKPKFGVISGADLPVDWLGKNFACHQLAAKAKGKYLLFLDADEEIKPGLINSLIYRMETGGLSLLSLFTNQVMKSLGEWLTVPLMHFILINLLPLRLIRYSANPAFSAASGQCMFFDAEIYHENQWHLQVKNQVVEDVEIMKCVKLKQLKGEALLSNGLIYCRMYHNLHESVNGFSKNLLAGFGNNLFILIAYTVLVIVGPVVLLFNFNIDLLILPLSLIFLSRIMIAYLAGQSVMMNLILHTLQMISFFVISLISIKNYLFNTGTWKGRKLKVK